MSQQRQYPRQLSYLSPISSGRPSARPDNDVDRIGSRVVDDGRAALFELPFYAAAFLLKTDIAVTIVRALSQHERFDDPGQGRIREVRVWHLNHDSVGPLAQT